LFCHRASQKSRSTAHALPGFFLVMMALNITLRKAPGENFILFAPTLKALRCIIDHAW